MSAANEPGRKAINLDDLQPLLASERENIAFFEQLPATIAPAWTSARSAGPSSSNRCSSSPAPAPGAARRRTSKLLSQLFGDRLTVANATGCSSIYGGNQPTTPWTVDAAGHGPAWSNSLFEDNAEFGLGCASRPTATTSSPASDCRSCATS